MDDSAATRAAQGTRPPQRTRVATRRRGGADLDDLKARLGIQEPSATPGAPDPAPSSAGDDSAADESTFASADDAASAPEAARPAAPAATPAATPAAASGPAPASPSAAPAAPPRPAAPPAPRPADLEDFANAVDSDIAPTPMASTDDVPLDISPKAEVPILAVVGAVALLVVGALLGVMAGSGNAGRQINNARMDGARDLLTAIEPVTVQIATLNGQLQGIDADARYNADFETRLRETYEGNRPEVRATALTTGAAPTVLAVDPNLTRMIVEYVNATQQLAILVDDHLRRTQRDLPEIERELANIQDERAIGVVFPFEQIVEAYNRLFDDPTSTWAPVIGERVFLASMEATRPEAPADAAPDAPAPPPAYQAQSATGQDLTIPVTNLVFIPRAQLLPAITAETPISRYRARASAIKNAIETLAQQQSGLADQLRDIANQPRVFTF